MGARVWDGMGWDGRVLCVYYELILFSPGGDDVVDDVI